MTPTLRAELDRIEECLLGPDGGALWEVLTALRGPDDPTTDKTCTTAVIRTAAFPRLAASDHNLSAIFALPATKFDARTATGHFRCHAHWAALVLELG